MNEKICAETEMPKACGKCYYAFSCRNVNSETYDYADCKHPNRTGRINVTEYANKGIKPEDCPAQFKWGKAKFIDENTVEINGRIFKEQPND